MDTDRPLRRALPRTVGILLTALGIAGLVRGGRQGWGGFIYGPDRVIGIVEPRSAAAAAVVYRPRGPNRLAQGALVVLLAFLWCGLWARLTVKTAPARALARVGLAAGVMAAAARNRSARARAA